MLVAGLLALSKAATPPVMLLYAIGTGVGFGLTVLAVTVLLLNYYGRQSNLELFSLTCLVGAVSAAGPFIGGAMRDRLGSFAPFANPVVEVGPDHAHQDAKYAPEDRCNQFSSHPVYFGTPEA